MNWKTTTAGVLTAVGTLIAVAVTWLKTGTLDASTAAAGVTGLLVAVGLWKAADG